MGLVSFTGMPSLSLPTIAIHRPREANIYRVLEKSRRTSGRADNQSNHRMANPNHHRRKRVSPGREGKGRDQIEGEMARWVREALEIPHRNKIQLRSSEHAEDVSSAHSIDGQLALHRMPNFLDREKYGTKGT